MIIMFKQYKNSTTSASVGIYSMAMQTTNTMLPKWQVKVVVRYKINDT